MGAGFGRSRRHPILNSGEEQPSREVWIDRLVQQHDFDALGRLPGDACRGEHQVEQGRSRPPRRSRPSDLHLDIQYLAPQPIGHVLQAPSDQRDAPPASRAQGGHDLRVGVLLQPRDEVAAVAVDAVENRAIASTFRRRCTKPLRRAIAFSRRVGIRLVNS